MVNGISHLATSALAFMWLIASALAIETMKVYAVADCDRNHFNFEPPLLPLGIPDGDGTQKGDCHQAPYVPKSTNMFGDDEKINATTCYFFPEESTNCIGDYVPGAVVRGYSSSSFLGHLIPGSGLCHNTDFTFTSKSVWYQCWRG